jgi:enoyl-CoA hydratase/carnithine racemase
MQKDENILVEKRDHIATVTLNRPAKLNALLPEMFVGLVQTFAKLNEDKEVNVIVLTGVGRAFCSGADVKEGFMKTLDPEVLNDLFWERFGHKRTEGTETITMMPKPTIAAINGLAVGHGVSLTLHCDIRIASEVATFCPGRYTQMSLTPAGTLLYLLPRQVGMGQACELMLTGKTIDAKEALRIGLVNQVVPANKLLETTYEMATTIAKLPPLALKIIKMNLRRMVDTDYTTAQHIENLVVPYIMASEDFAEATHAFVEKRPPVFKGR